MRVSTVSTWANIVPELWSEGLDAIENVYFNFFPATLSNAEQAQPRQLEGEKSASQKAKQKSSIPSPKMSAALGFFKKLILKRQEEIRPSPSSSAITIELS